jgi:hypothetical protein
VTQEHRALAQGRVDDHMTSRSGERHQAPKCEVANNYPCLIARRCYSGPNRGRARGRASASAMPINTRRSASFTQAPLYKAVMRMLSSSSVVWAYLVLFYLFIQGAEKFGEHQLRARRLEAEIRQNDERLAIERQKLPVGATPRLPDNFQALLARLSAHAHGQPSTLSPRQLLDQIDQVPRDLRMDVLRKSIDELAASSSPHTPLSIASATLLVESVGEISSPSGAVGFLGKLADCVGSAGPGGLLTKLLGDAAENLEKAALIAEGGASEIKSAIVDTLKQGTLEAIKTGLEIVKDRLAKKEAKEREALVPPSETIINNLTVTCGSSQRVSSSHGGGGTGPKEMPPCGGGSALLCGDAAKQAYCATVSASTASK